MLAVLDNSNVRDRLLGSDVPSTVHACEFFIADSADDVPTIVVVMIVSYGEWDDEAERACEEASAAARAALGDLAAYVDVICRTKAEHDASRGDGPWVAIDGNC